MFAFSLPRVQVPSANPFDRFTWNLEHGGDHVPDCRKSAVCELRTKFFFLPDRTTAKSSTNTPHRRSLPQLQRIAGLETLPAAEPVPLSENMPVKAWPIV